MRRALPERVLALCREMRQNPTTGEAMLWRLLRNRRLELKFRRQHPLGRYILDFYCHEARLAIEVDGGGHAEPDQQRQDAQRDEALRSMGIRVLRFWNRDVLTNTEGVLATIWHTLTPALSQGERETPTSPSGRGGAQRG